jgi:iron(III) transport system substrate-binding protein
MAQRSRRLLIVLLLFYQFFGLIVFLAEVRSQTGAIDKSFEEIVKLAVKESRVRVGAGMSREDATVILKGFNQKYPMIKVEITRTSGPEPAERLLNEALARVVEYDLYDIPAAMQNRFVKSGALAGPIEWQKLFPNIPQVHFSPDGYFNALGFNLRILAYNPSLVPTARIPKNWSDCLDPYWKGKMAVDTNPRSLSGLFKSWGEARIVEYASQLKQNQPIWKSGQAEALAQLAAGEFSMLCGAHYASIHRLLRQDPKAKIAMSIPGEVPVSLGQTMAVMKGAPNPNAALLFSAWSNSADGQIFYDQVGRGSPFVPGTEQWKAIANSGAKTIFEGWDRTDYEPIISKKIAAAWGFPVGK